MSPRIRVLIIVTALALSVAGIASASEHDGEAVGQESGEELTEELVDSWFWYDETTMQLIYALPDPDTNETPDCAAPEDPEADPTAAGDVAVFELPEGCRSIDVVGPSGKVTHGSVVSAFVHSLKEDYDKAAHGPKGHWVREVAWSEYGKKSFDEGEGLEAAEAGPGKSNKPKKPKKPKKNG